MNAQKTDESEKASGSADLADRGEGQNGFRRPLDIDPQVCEDWLWIFEQYRLGALMPYFGQTIAVVGKSIKGTGQNATQLQEEVCRRLGVPAERVVLKYVD